MIDQRDAGTVMLVKKRSSPFFGFWFFLSLPAETTGGCEEMKHIGVCGVFEGSRGRM